LEVGDWRLETVEKLKGTEGREEVEVEEACKY